jgi:hypothetical protein
MFFSRLILQKDEWKGAEVPIDRTIYNVLKVMRVSRGENTKTGDNYTCNTLFNSIGYVLVYVYVCMCYVCVRMCVCVCMCVVCGL